MRVEKDQLWSLWGSPGSNASSSDRFCMPCVSWPPLTCLVSSSATPYSSLINSLWLRFLQQASRSFYMLLQLPAAHCSSLANSSSTSFQWGWELLPVLQCHGSVGQWSNLPWRRSSHGTRDTHLKGYFLPYLVQFTKWMNEWMNESSEMLQGKGKRWEEFR